MTPEVVEAQRARERRSREEAGLLDEAAERRLEEARARETLPAFGRILADAEGYLWVQDYGPPRAEPSATWSVFDPEGRWLGEVELPPGLHVEQVGDDFVLGTWTDDLDVEYVRIHDLERR